MSKVVPASGPWHLLFLLPDVLSSMLLEKWAPPYPSDLSSNATSPKNVTIPATVASSLLISLYLFLLEH